MKNLLILLIILINPLIGYTQYKFDMSKGGTGIDNYPEHKMSKVTKVKKDTIPKSVVIINDTIKYLMTSNKLLTNGINQYYKQSRTGQHQVLIGTALTTLGSLLIPPTINKPTEKFPYILITTGLTFNIVGSINRYLAYKHLNLNWSKNINY